MRRLVVLAVVGLSAFGGGTAHPAGPDQPTAVLDQDPSGHQGHDGAPLVAARRPDLRLTAAAPCGEKPVRRYHVVAVAVDITLNRYGDHDPHGRAFVLEERLEALRDQEREAALAREGDEPVPVSLGLQGDAVQPLTLRVLPGECLRVAVRNDVLDEPISFHLHGVPLMVARTGRPATEREPSAVVPPGKTVAYAWSVPAAERDGTHYAHSHSDGSELARRQTEHGLYAAVIVEPPGARWLDPRSGSRATGWDAVVVRPDGTSFREFAIFYAEDGDEPYQPLTRRGAFVPLVDELTGAYKPGGRWVNYRSEPFLNRMALARRVQGTYDESGAYSSYSFGDPATPMMRSYVGDPVVQRVVHAGAEVLHVHHVHGGSIRWRRQPGLGPTDATAGLTKRPALLPGRSERTDAQTLAPAETFDQWAECGSGGCQASVGDFLWHCHVAHHYFAGMWGLWRVYGTLQDGRVSTDALPPLRALPDRSSAVLPAVRASALVGRTLDLAGRGTRVTPVVLQEWLNRVLPPSGVPRPGGAGLWDWVRSGLDVLGEPEDSRTWPGWTSSSPGRRPQVLFDPRTGLPAYPFLRPHLGKRPPFAAGHGPAPYLDPPAGADVPAPGLSGPRSTCPSGTRRIEMPVTAALLPVSLAPGITDPHGQLFVLNSELSAARADPARRVPLVVRARAQRDCVDVTLVSALTDETTSHGLSKVDMHVHFVQFDVQGSDGVVAGFNAEQSVRPWRTATVALRSRAAPGARVLDLAAVPLVRAGESLALGPEHPDGAEIVQVAAVRGLQLLLRAPVRRAHPAGEPTTTEFVRYRWYPDAQTGTAYFHDHVDALRSWRHGLFGALVVEPPDATWTHPVTGAPVASGAQADVTTEGRVGLDAQGSFREQVVLLQDDVRVNQSSRSTGGALGMRASPPLGTAGQPAAVLRAYVGDPLVFRTLVTATNDVHTFFLQGHRFRTEPWSRTSPYVAAVRVGIAERYDVVVPAAGGDGRRSGDFVFGDGRTSKLREGVWGVLRVLGRVEGSLRPLSGRPAPSPADRGDICPSDAAVRRLSVTAVELPLPMLNGGRGAALVPSASLAESRQAPDRVEPLTLHLAAGECLRIRLRNLTPQPVRLDASLLESDPGAARVAAPGAETTSSFWAPEALAGSVAVLRDGARPLDGPARGLYGSVVVMPPGAEATAADGGDLDEAATGTQVVVRPRAGAAYRDLTVFLHDSDSELGTHQMPYRHQVVGNQSASYRRAPDVPVLEATAGEPVRLHFVAAVSEQVQGVALDGHRWRLEPDEPSSSVVAAQALGAGEVLSVVPLGGAGGEGGRAGDYAWTSTRAPYRDAGVQGVLRVHPRATGRLAPLEPREDRPWWPALAVLALSAAALLRTMDQDPRDQKRAQLPTG